MQIDKINIVVISVHSGNGSNRKKTLSAAKTSNSLLLMFNITYEIGTLVRWMNRVATSEAIAIQLRDDQIIGRFRRLLANQTSPFSPSPTLNLIHKRDLRRTNTAISTQ